jgi:ParB-like nuclease domain
MVRPAAGGRNGRSRGRTGPRPGFQLVPLSSIRTAPENEAIYGKIDPDDPDIVRLAASIKRFGLKQPIVISRDNYILSGNRRFAACLRLGLAEIKAVYEDVRRTDPGFEALLVAYNDEQRDKTPAVRVREQIVLTDPEDAYRAVLSRRAEEARVKVAPLAVGRRRDRHDITKAKRPFLDAVRRVIDELRDHWPLSDRRIHYVLLNDPPLRHASKPDSVYRNDHASYKSLIDLLTRGRIEGLIEFEAIGDETRPVQTWNPHPNVAPLVVREIGRLFANYWRDLMQGQPNHVEIVAEKLTVEGTIRPVAADFTIPYTVGRGFSSLPPRKAMFDRYDRSGKEELVILFLADHDPEGMCIPEAFARSMRDDFGVGDVHPVRVGLTPEQVRRLDLPANTDAKTTSSRYRKYVEEFGRAAYELDAVPVATLRRWLREAIEAVIDVDAFNAQVEQAKRDAATLEVLRRGAVEYLKGLRFDETGYGPVPARTTERPGERRRGASPRRGAVGDSRPTDGFQK